MADVQNVDAAIRRSDGGDFVEFGGVFNGVFHPFGAVRSGDFDEAQAAGQEPAQAPPAAEPAPVEPQAASEQPAEPAAEG